MMRDLAAGKILFVVRMTSIEFGYLIIFSFLQDPQIDFKPVVFATLCKSFENCWLNMNKMQNSTNMSVTRFHHLSNNDMHHIITA